MMEEFGDVLCSLVCGVASPVLLFVRGALPWTGRGEKSGRKRCPSVLHMVTRGERQAGTLPEQLL